MMAQLNLFQRIMLLWDDVLPYNAVHAFRVDLALDLESLRRAIRATQEGCGYSCEGDEVVLRKYRDSSSPGDALAEVFRAELNERFARTACALPFRFFVIPSAGGGFFFGVCYFHLVSGGDSVCWMLEDIVSRYAGGPEALATGCGGNRPPTYRSLFPRHVPYFWRWVRSVPADIRRSRSFARLPMSESGGDGMAVLTHPLTEEQWNWIRERREEGGATFSDVLLCLALVAAATDLTKKKSRLRRNKIAVGSIANTREHFGAKHARTFGLFVAFTSVAQAVPEGVRFGELLAEVRRETEETKRDRLYLRDLIKLQGSLLWMKFHSPGERRGFYRKFFPLSAGVTGFFVDRFQTHLTELPVSDYWRAVSASPANPLVLACTTFEGQANITVTYDRALYSDEDAGSYLERFLKTMKSETGD